MRVIRLSVWHSLLILLIIWGLFTTFVAVAERFAIAWQAPGLMTLMMLVALEAIVTQRLVARNRQRFEEQAGARLVELVLIVVLVRIWSIVAQGEPLGATIGPWLREPLLFVGGRFFEYFVWSMIGWLVATLLTADVINWGDETTAVIKLDDTIEREQMQQEWDQAVVRYDRRFAVVVLLTLAATAFALSNSTSISARPFSASPQHLSIAAITVVIAGLLLHSAGRLDQLRRAWNADQIAVEPDVARHWGRSGILILAGLVLLAPLLGLLVVVAPPPPLVPVANAILVVMTVAVSLVVLLLGVLLSPLILLLSLFDSTDRMPPVAPRMLPPPQIADVRGDRPLWPALIFWGCVLVLVGIALVRYARSRSDLREALLRWRIVRWLVGWSTELWADTRGWISLATARAGRLRHRRNVAQTRGQARGSQAQIRALYRRMREAAMQRGVPAGKAQTPYEFDAELGRALPVARDDAHALVEVYATAEYGPMLAGPAEVQHAQRSWGRLKRRLQKPDRVRDGPGTKP